ncbi:hypothetical protein [Peribacillus simplex]|uniref:hypothetical protein n=1 Tax=Peribacillus simplex TaxID=1478 RepID=UPI003D287138
MPNVAEIIEAVNTLADEQSPTNQIILWLNNAIARINMEANAKFPFIKTETETPAIPDEWHFLLLVPYATARIKQMDSSQFEYRDLFDEFETNLKAFVFLYPIPDEYKNAEIGDAQSIKVIYGVD